MNKFIVEKDALTEKQRLITAAKQAPDFTTLSKLEQEAARSERLRQLREMAGQQYYPLCAIVSITANGGTVTIIEHFANILEVE